MFRPVNTFLLIVVFTACKGEVKGIETSDAGLVDDVDYSDQFYEQELIDIKLSLPEDKWNQLRYETRTRIDLLGGELCSATPYGKAFNYQEATIEIDGDTYTNIGIRKKGYGSQSTTKPSLKIDLSKYGASQKHLSVGRFVINNNKSDNTELRQCFSYRLMEQAGLPTPRCTFAKVSVNNTELGVFTVVEEVKKPFLERHFGSSNGNLYEGESNDFRSAFMGFDQDNNEDVDSTRTDIAHARQVLENATPESALEDVASLIDLDAFYRHWAAEVMIWHRDGYAGNLNNFFFYADPADNGRFKFIPWGTDNVMRNEARTTIPHSTLAFSIIPHLLYQTTEGRTRFYQELDALMATVWDEEDINAWIDEKAALLQPHIRDVDVEHFQPQIDILKQTVLDRRQVFSDARADGDPDWNAGMRGEICRVEKGTISGTIDVEWDSRTPANYAAGTGDLTMTFDGTEIPAVISSGQRQGI